MKKLISMLLVLVLSMGLATAAFAADGTYADPYLVTAGGEAIVITVPAEGDAYCKVDVPASTISASAAAGSSYDIAQGRFMSAADADGAATLELIADFEGSFYIRNKGTADLQVSISAVAAPVEDASGTFDDPIILEDISYFDVSLKAQSSDSWDDPSVYYKWTAPADGLLSLNIGFIEPESVQADIIVISDSGAYLSLDLDGEMDDWGYKTLSMDVKAGDILSIQVVAIPDDNFNYPAAELSVMGNLAGTPENPIFLMSSKEIVSVPAGATYYFATRADGMTLEVKGENFALIHNEATIDPVNGVASVVLVGDPMMRGTCIFGIQNKGEAAAEFSAEILVPLGDYTNPQPVEKVPSNVELHIGENDSDGYDLMWTAPADGKLYVWLVSNSVGVDVILSNEVSYAMEYLCNYDDAGNLVPGEYVCIDVAAGDAVRINVVALMDENWNTPAADVVLGMSMDLADMNPEEPDPTGDIFGTVVALMAVTGLGITVLAKKKF